MDFDINLMRDDRCTLVRVQGDIDVLSRERFEEAMFKVVESGEPLVVDMREVTFCDSTGLNAIVAANRRATEHGTAIALVALPPRVQRVFHITGIDKFIPVYETLREALGALPSTSRP
ncbi:SpoIIAA-like anti-anti-sigma regulatory factor [Actinomadura pelletieri DSM 43383]|uniref:Anti-sigma factor antagonist n=1 Tax=Actinomadura pelletieri DSM 43383 TaxID=1120940 RepID=A0A495QZS7_9ACTN|nr:STAS domain-containing protein [Actinomadura pelletieri]RKS79464.1 SpoIIAA-like anti-anti-sigma regulatory factor [Actinomadura pelletieri DSM 43383]